MGDTHIIETILDLKFRVSPEAFFQINRDAAEILYSSAIELASPCKDSTVVDVCCGTGTIGLCFAKVSVFFFLMLNVTEVIFVFFYSFFLSFTFSVFFKFLPSFLFIFLFIC